MEDGRIGAEMRLLEKLINSEVLGSQGGDDGCNKRL
jgi:hypothetical protein